MHINEVTIDQLKEACAMIQERFPELGYALFVFPFLREAQASKGFYMSNADRVDMIQNLQRTIDSLKTQMN
jgi:hypothetical protein